MTSEKKTKKTTGEKLFVVSAPSGAGKSTLTNLVAKMREDIRMSISCTTRPKRGDEQEGREYYFLTQEEFFQRQVKDEFLEWAQVHGNYYGTSRHHVNDLLEQGFTVLFDIDVQGASKLKEVYPDATLIFILPPTKEELRRRLKERKTDDPKEIEKRLANAAGEILEAARYDFIIVNDELEKAKEELYKILTDGKADKRKQQKALSRLQEEFHHEPSSP